MNPQPQQQEMDPHRRRLVIMGIILAVLAVGGISLLLTDDESAEPTVTEADNGDAEVEPGEAGADDDDDDGVTDPEDAELRADEVRLELLAALGTDDFQTYCGDMPDSWVCAITDVTSGKQGEATVHVQRTMNRSEADETAMKVWNLVQERVSWLDTVMVETPDGTHGMVFRTG